MITTWVTEAIKQKMKMKIELLVVTMKQMKQMKQLLLVASNLGTIVIAITEDSTAKERNQHSNLGITTVIKAIGSSLERVEVSVAALIDSLCSRHPSGTMICHLVHSFMVQRLVALHLMMRSYSLRCIKHFGLSLVSLAPSSS